MTTKNTSTIISSVYNSRNVVLELMDNQGYNTEGYANFSVTEVNTMFQNKQLDMLLEMKVPNNNTNRKNKIYICYYLEKTIRPTNIQEMIDDLFNTEEVLTKEDTLYIIIKDDMNDTIVNELIHIWEKYGIFIIIENIKRLQFNILKHQLVPEHRLMTKEASEIMMKKYNIKDTVELPDISRFDPIAQKIGLRPGQVCEISRPSKTAIVTKYYRYCV